MEPGPGAELHDEQAKMIQEHVWVASHAARRFARRGEPSDDLFQVACLGLVKAARRFDPDRGVRFATFAMPTVVGEIRRHFRDRTWGLRVSRGLKDLHLELRTATERLTHELGRAPAIEELANVVDVSGNRIVAAMGAASAYQPLSVDAAAADGEPARTTMLPAVVDEAVNATPERRIRETWTWLTPSSVAICACVLPW